MGEGLSQEDPIGSGLITVLPFSLLFLNLFFDTLSNWKEWILNIHWKDWCWTWSSNALVMWFEEPKHWKRPWCWEPLMSGGEGNDRGWDDWMASPTQWAWVWANSGRWWRAGKPGVLQFVRSQKVRHDRWTERQWRKKVLQLEKCTEDNLKMEFLYASCLNMSLSICLNVAGLLNKKGVW